MEGVQRNLPPIGGVRLLGAYRAHDEPAVASPELVSPDQELLDSLQRRLAVRQHVVENLDSAHGGAPRLAACVQHSDVERAAAPLVWADDVARNAKAARRADQTLRDRNVNRDLGDIAAAIVESIVHDRDVAYALERIAVGLDIDGSRHGRARAAHEPVVADLDAFAVDDADRIAVVAVHA